MYSTIDVLFASINDRVHSHGIQVKYQSLGLEKPAIFDGLSITLDPARDLETRVFYLAHSFGSIVLWSLDPQGTQRLFDELRESKEHKATDPVRFAKALECFRQFEEACSEFAVGIFVDSRNDWIVPLYTSFFRADIEAMLIFHKEGVAPVWARFFVHWERRVASGEQQLIPFQPRAVPTFTPTRIPLQEVIQEVDGKE